MVGGPISELIHRRTRWRQRRFSAFVTLCCATNPNIGDAGWLTPTSQAAGAQRMGSIDLRCTVLFDHLMDAQLGRQRSERRKPQTSHISVPLRRRVQRDNADLDLRELRHFARSPSSALGAIQRCRGRPKAPRTRLAAEPLPMRARPEPRPIRARPEPLPIRARRTADRRPAPRSQRRMPSPAASSA